MNGRILDCHDLSDSHRHDMLSLMCRHFEGITPARFTDDLAQKNRVILLEDPAGRLRGFSTLLVYDSTVAPVRVAYSGDTIVDPAAWGSPALLRTWIQAVRQLRAEYWLLITSGFRTYRFLPVFWREFWPRHDAPEPPVLLDLLARERFGDRYAHGLVRFHQPQRLRGALADIPPGRLADPHIAFFARRNPGWASGDELVCLCDLAPANLSPAGLRVCGQDRPMSPSTPQPTSDDPSPAPRSSA